MYPDSSTDFSTISWVRRMYGISPHISPISFLPIFRGETRSSEASLQPVLRKRWGDANNSPTHDNIQVQCWTLCCLSQELLLSLCSKRGSLCMLSGTCLFTLMGCLLLLMPPCICQSSLLPSLRFQPHLSKFFLFNLLKEIANPFSLLSLLNGLVIFLERELHLWWSSEPSWGCELNYLCGFSLGRIIKWLNLHNLSENLVPNLP